MLRIQLLLRGLGRRYLDSRKHTGAEHGSISHPDNISFARSDCPIATKSERVLRYLCSGHRNIFDAASLFETPAKTAPRGLAQDLPGVLLAISIATLKSDQSNTACCKSSKAFNSSSRPVRALPASVLISASAMGPIPCRPLRLVAEV